MLALASAIVVTARRVSFATAVDSAVGREELAFDFPGSAACRQPPFFLRVFESEEFREGTADCF